MNLRKIERGYNKQVVDILSGLLEEAKKGQISSVVVTFQLPGSDNIWSHRWSGCDNLFELVGVLERQKFATLNRMSCDE